MKLIILACIKIIIEARLKLHYKQVHTILYLLLMNKHLRLLGDTVCMRWVCILTFNEITNIDFYSSMLAFFTSLPFRAFFAACREHSTLYLVEKVADYFPGHGTPALMRQCHEIRCQIRIKDSRKDFKGTKSKKKSQ
jgi:hypothetical protein